MREHVRGMNNQRRRTNFTPSDDALIRQQPVTGIGLKRLASILRTCAGPTSSAFHWSSAMIMTRKSTRERSAAPIDSLTRYWKG